jgi:hypothetical protein
MRRERDEWSDSKAPGARPSPFLFAVREKMTITPG